jgi:hypothetical protein
VYLKGISSGIFCGAKGLGISFFKMPWCFTLVKLEGEGITEIRAYRRQ